MIAQIPRAEWLRCHFDYQPGQGLGAWEPTQQGKSFLLWQAAEVATERNPGLRAVALMPKPRDAATRMHADRLGWKIIDSWPPPPRLPLQKPPPGYVLWPRHARRASLADRRARLADHFRRCLADQLWRGESLTIADDAHNLMVLGCNREIEDLLTIGGSSGAGIWLAAQKTSGTRDGGSLTTFAYSQPEHHLLGYEPIAENRRRFADIGSVDPRMIADIVASLPRHPVNTPAGIKYVSDKLHIDKRGPFLCQVTGL